MSYTVSSADSAKDKSDSDVWMTSWDGTQTIRVTSTPEGESKARWSPDGKYLSFVSSRQGAGERAAVADGPRRRGGRDLGTLVGTWGSAIVINGEWIVGDTEIFTGDATIAGHATLRRVP